MAQNGRQEPGDPFGDALAELRRLTQLAENFDAFAVESFRVFGRRPFFEAVSADPDYNEATARDEARKKLRRHASWVTRIEQDLEEFDSLYDMMLLFRQAVALNQPTLWVGQQSYATAHEAAAAWARFACDAWKHADADHVAQIAPGRWEARANTPAASIAYDCCLNLWRSLRRVKKVFPGSFDGRIQQEHYAVNSILVDREALRLCEEEEESPRPTPTAAAGNVPIDGGASANSANNPKLFCAPPPDNLELVRLVVALDAAKGSGKSYNEIAREITGETTGKEPRAQVLLAQVRRLKRDGKITL